MQFPCRLLTWQESWRKGTHDRLCKLKWKCVWDDFKNWSEPTMNCVHCNELQWTMINEQWNVFIAGPDGNFGVKSVTDLDTVNEDHEESWAELPNWLIYVSVLRTFFWQTCHRPSCAVCSLCWLVCVFVWYSVTPRCKYNNFFPYMSILIKHLELLRLLFCFLNNSPPSAKSRVSASEDNFSAALQKVFSRPVSIKKQTMAISSTEIIENYFKIDKLINWD